MLTQFDLFIKFHPCISGRNPSVLKALFLPSLKEAVYGPSDMVLLVKHYPCTHAFYLYLTDGPSGELGSSEWLLHCFCNAAFDPALTHCCLMGNFTINYALHGLSIRDSQSASKYYIQGVSIGKSRKRKLLQIHSRYANIAFLFIKHMSDLDLFKLVF